MNENWIGANKTTIGYDHVTKGLIHLDSLIPKWMTLFPRLFSRLFNVDVRYSLFVTPADRRHILAARRNRVEWLASFSFVSRAHGYGNGVILNSMDKIAKTFGYCHRRNNYFFSVLSVTTDRIDCYRVRKVLEIHFWNWNSLIRCEDHKHLFFFFYFRCYCCCFFCI